MAKTITMASIKKTLRILDFIKRYMASNGEPPTLAEIARHFEFRSLSSVFDHLAKMEERGWIRRTKYVSRGIEIVEQKQIAA